MSTRAGWANFDQHLLQVNARDGPYRDNRHDIITSGIRVFCISVVSFFQLWSWKTRCDANLVGSFHPFCVFFNGWKWRFCRFMPLFSMCSAIPLVVITNTYDIVQSVPFTKLIRTDCMELLLSFHCNCQSQQVNIYSPFRLWTCCNTLLSLPCDNQTVLLV